MQMFPTHNPTETHPSSTFSRIEKISPRDAPCLERQPLLMGFQYSSQVQPGLDRNLVMEQRGSHYSFCSSLGYCKVLDTALASLNTNVNKEHFHISTMAQQSLLPTGITLFSPRLLKIPQISFFFLKLNYRQQCIQETLGLDISLKHHLTECI